jgi:hypothetical protein
VALIDRRADSGAAQEPPETTPPDDGAGAGAGWDAACWAAAVCCAAEPEPVDPPAWLGAAWGAAPGACRPSSLALASGGICATDDRFAEAPAMLAVVLTLDFEAALENVGLAPSERPGATAETTAARPADRAAAPTKSARLVRLTRIRAASRWRPASGLFRGARP